MYYSIVTRESDKIAFSIVSNCILNIELICMWLTRHLQGTHSNFLNVSDHEQGDGGKKKEIIQYRAEKTWVSAHQPDVSRNTKIDRNCIFLLVIFITIVNLYE